MSDDREVCRPELSTLSHGSDAVDLSFTKNVLDKLSNDDAHELASKEEIQQFVETYGQDRLLAKSDVRTNGVEVVYIEDYAKKCAGEYLAHYKRLVVTGWALADMEATLTRFARQVEINAERNEAEGKEPAPSDPFDLKPKHRRMLRAYVLASVIEHELSHMDDNVRGLRHPPKPAERAESDLPLTELKAHATQILFCQAVTESWEGKTFPQVRSSKAAIDELLKFLDGQLNCFWSALGDDSQRDLVSTYSGRPVDMMARD